MDLSTGDLNAILIFVAVVDAGSFTGAAKTLGVPKSRVSRKLAALEAHLGARLLQRTTRSLRLTDVGAAYYERAKRVVDAVEDAERVVADSQAEPHGDLHVAVPLGFGFLGAAFATFATDYPRVRLHVTSSDRLVDLVAEGVHVAVRAGALADSSLVARRLGTAPRLLVASPSYLAGALAPAHPEDLKAHACLLFTSSSTPQTWHLQRGGQRVAVQLAGALRANDYDVLREAAIRGLGIAALPVFRCDQDVRGGQLVSLLAEWRAAEIPLHVVYPSTRQLAPKVRALVDALLTYFTPPPWAC